MDTAIKDTGLIMLITGAGGSLEMLSKSAVSEMYSEKQL